VIKIKKFFQENPESAAKLLWVPGGLVVKKLINTYNTKNYVICL
jgi:hypothetical protein